jgi:hypothetical protein
MAIIVIMIYDPRYLPPRNALNKHRLIPWCGIFLEKFIVTQLVRKWGPPLDIILRQLNQYKRSIAQDFWKIIRWHPSIHLAFVSQLMVSLLVFRPTFGMHFAFLPLVKHSSPTQYSLHDIWRTYKLQSSSISNLLHPSSSLCYIFSLRSFLRMKENIY